MLRVLRLIVCSTSTSKIVKNDTNENCIICYEHMSENFLIDCLYCKKIYHTKCINIWININNSCPWCRSSWK